MPFAETAFNAGMAYNFPRVLLLAKLWGNFYLVAKYGYEELGVGADKLFKKQDVELAHEHAGEAYSACKLAVDELRRAQ